jgi:hypothetical protein
VKAWIVLAALASTGCVTAQVALPPTDAADLARALPGEMRFLRVSMYVTPFFGDATKRLLTPVPPELVRLLDGTDGKPLNPGAVDRIIPAGTPVRMTKVEFPSTRVMAERVLYTPRTLVWIYVELPSAPKNAPPLLAVLRPGLRARDEFMTEFERHFSLHPLDERLERLPEHVREAISKKVALVDMSSEALEMAWGFPESKRFELEGTERKETWKWAEGARSAVLVDGRVTQLNGPNRALP